MKGEGLGVENGDLDGFVVVELGHTFNFSELHVVAILIDVGLVFVEGNFGGLTFFEVGNDEGFGLFTICVSNDVFSKIGEGITPWSKSLGGNVSNFIFSANFIDNRWI